MSTRNLEALFTPRAIALIGASSQTGSVGAIVARNLASAGFEGALFSVNPRATDILGHASFHSIADLPVTPDLAVIATPPRTVPQLIEELSARGTRAAVVITAGLDAALRQTMLDAARPPLMRIIGPNCLGFLSPVRGINASFAHMAPLKGQIAFLTQSGAIATSIIDWATGRGIGFSHIVSLGDMADVDFGDLLDFLALDLDTRAILLYAETVTQARKFMSAGRMAARSKPVIVVKGGRTRAGSAAAASHTGALAGADAVYDAVFRRAGMLRVDTLRDLFDAAETLSSGLHVFGDRLTILTNGGGLGVLAADALELSRGRLTQLSPETRRRLDAVLPTSWSHANPVDILGDAQGDRYRAALDILTDPQASDALLVMNCPTGVGDSMDAARTVVDAVKAHPGRPVIGCWMGEATTTAPRALLSQSGIPNYETPDEAVSAFLHLAEYSQNQRSLFETPVRDLKSAPNRRADAARIISAAILEGREMLTEPEAKAVLSAYNIPVVTTRVVGTPAEAGAAAAAMDGRVALKILSRQISHKTDVGGVRLDLQGETDTRIAAEDMLRHVSAAMPDATIDGFTVQRMIRRPQAQELLLGAVLDPTFGPCLMFGQGGIAAEVIADRCMGLPPLNANLAQDMIGRTRVARLLAGYRDRPPANLGAIEAALVALSDLVVDFPEVAELDINPLLADAQGVIALDARIIVRKPQNAASRLAIKPYPSELARNVTVDGLSLGLRPIRPEDSRLLLEMAQRTAPEDLRLRFHGGGGVISETSAARLSQIDYDREMVFLAEMAPGDVGGVVRLVFTSGFDAAECAIIVRTDLQNRRIGRTLLGEALAYAASRGTQTVWGDVMNGNSMALGLGRKLGGVLSPSPIDGGLTRIVFTLGPGLPCQAVLEPDQTPSRASGAS